MKKASDIIIALKKGENLLFTFAKNADGAKTNFEGYKTKKIDKIWSFIESQNYFDGASAHDRAQVEAFRHLIKGSPLQTETQRQTVVNAAIACMSSDELAKFAAFVHREERFETGYLANRIVDGAMQTMVARIEEMGPRVAGQTQYPGSEFTRAVAEPKRELSKPSLVA